LTSIFNFNILNKQFYNLRELMEVYVLVEHTAARPHGLYDEVISTSTNKRLIFKEAKRLSHEELSNRSSWRDNTYWIHIFDNKTGKKLEKLEFDSNGRREGTFGKIVRNRGSKDQQVVGTWYKKDRQVASPHR
jgi:hypothetical protein